MAREVGKYGKVTISTTETAIVSEVAVLNVAPESLGGVSYAALRIATLANKFVLPDRPEAPITIVLAKGAGSDIPTDISWKVDYALGKIIFDQALTTGNTVTVSYYHAASFVHVGDLTEWSIDEAIKEQDLTAFDDEWEQYGVLQKNWTASLTGALNLTIWDAVNGTSDSATVTVAGKMIYLKLYKNRGVVAAGNPYFSGAGFFSGFSPKVPYAGKVEFTTGFRGTGGLSKIIA